MYKSGYLFNAKYGGSSTSGESSGESSNVCC